MRVHSIYIEPHDPAMSALSGEISTAESQGGREMLSVLVVHKYGDKPTEALAV